jgi:hypothetical protein
MPCATVVTTLSCRLLIFSRVSANLVLYALSSGGQSRPSSAAAKYLLLEVAPLWSRPLPLPLPFSGAERYWPFWMLGFCVALMSGGVRLAGFRSRSLTSLDRFGRGSWTSSCAIVSQGSLKHVSDGRTSNDCAYQSRTRQIEGISLRPSGRSLSSCTRCANRMGSSSERNCDARKRVPVDGFSPNCTICRRETPGLTSDGLLTHHTRDPKDAPVAGKLL